MSQPDQPSSQDSIGTQEILSQGTFEEIWVSLQRTFSDPTCILEQHPSVIEYKDEDTQDDIQLSYTKFNVQQDMQPVLNGHSESILHETPESSALELPEILPNKSFPGRFNFQIDFEPNCNPITKATPWVYNAERQKLFVKMQCLCPIIFKFKGSPPPGSRVRGVLMYKKPENYKEIVARCPNHKNMSKNDFPNQDHVMRCENSKTIYESCPKTERFSLILPLSAVHPVENQGYFKELFKFTCFNSCVGGMNRRPTNLAFRLECGGKVEGLAVVEIRICASPGRDSSEKEFSGVKVNKNTEKPNNEPSSSTDVVSSTTQSPRSSPTTIYPQRASVLMSPRGDTTNAHEPVQFPITQAQKRRCPFKNDGFVVRCGGLAEDDVDDSVDQVYSLKIYGRKRYKILEKISDGLHLVDGIKPPDQNPQKYAIDENSQKFTKILPKPSKNEVKRENQDTSSQCSQSSQELNELSQLSQTSSNASSQSSQSSTSSNPVKYTAELFTLKRSLSLK